MVPIKPIQSVMEAVWESVKEATWKERLDGLVFFVWTVPLDIIKDVCGGRK